MNKERHSNYLKSRSFVASLRGLVNALPTDLEKHETETSIQLLIDFLGKVQRSFKTVPSSQDMNAVSQAIQKLEKLLADAEDNPLLANVIGLRARSATRERAPVITAENIDKAKAALAKLETLPIDEIRSCLQSTSYPVPELRALASLLGIRSSVRLGRDTLAHQITMKIANYRGYKRL